MARSTPKPTARLQGKAGQQRRERYLRLLPLCIKCEATGAVSAAAVVDHIVPLWAGGADDYGANGQGLCNRHHDVKTACEAAMRAAGGWMAAPCACGQHLPPRGGRF